MTTLFTKYVSSTYLSDELIQIGREQLRNKRIYIYFPYCTIIILFVAKFKTKLINLYQNLPSWIAFGQ